MPQPCGAGDSGGSTRGSLAGLRGCGSAVEGINDRKVSTEHLSGLFCIMLTSVLIMLIMLCLLCYAYYAMVCYAMLAVLMLCYAMLAMLR